ncbi:MAG: hypothetical protein WEC73_03250 [Chthoniobacterales bacterium]
MPARAFCLSLLCCAAGCATNPNNDVLIDPLKQRLIAREDIALQNLLFARAPAYGYGGGGGGSHSYLDAPYDGPAVEPPLPDLNLLPEDMPPWEELPQTPAPSESAPQPTPNEPAPMEAEAPSSTPSES